MNVTQEDFDDLNKKVVMVDKYLLQNFNNTLKRRLNNKSKLALLIETRCHYRLIHTIKNIFHFLDNEYDFLFICSLTSFYYVKHSLPNFEFHSEILNDNEEFTWEYHTHILTSKSLFERYSEYENIFIFQTNSLLLRPLPKYIYDYDYVGPCDYMIADDDNILITYNGGICFRKRSFIIKCLDTYSHDDITNKRKQLDMYTSDNGVYPEGFYYSQCLSLFTYNTIQSLDVTKCSFFAQNSDINVRNNLFDIGALHGYDKISHRYLKYDDIFQILKQVKQVKQ